MEPYELTLTEAAEQIRSRKLSPTELIDSTLARIEATEPTISAFAHVTDELARKAAADADQQIASGNYRGPLHGIPLGVKEMYNTAGVPTTASSKVREGHVPETDAVAVERLLAAGMVMVGKTHTHEFAYGGRTHDSRNPWDTSRVPGGSSGGSGAAVAAGSCMVGLGTDTAGSIRIPANLCGTVGIKPTFGLTSRRGTTSLSWSLDHVGPLTRHTIDSALVLNVMAGYDPLDPASLNVPIPDYSQGLTGDISGVRIGVPTNYFFEHVHADVDASVRGAIKVFEELGAEIREVEIPYADQIMGLEWAIVMPEASEYHQPWLREHADKYREETRLSLEAGEFILATDYIRALRIRNLMKQGWAKLLEDVDVVIAPVQPFVAPKTDDMEVTWADGTTESVDMAMVRLTAAGNLTGLPILAVPTAPDPAGLPTGMQLMGRPLEEKTVLNLGVAYEAATDHVGTIAPVV